MFTILTTIAIMETASVADLRNNFAMVSRWIYEGKEVKILKRGRPFAVLSPAGKKKKGKVQWPNFEKRLNRHFPNGPIKDHSAQEVVSDIRGDY